MGRYVKNAKVAINPESMVIPIGTTALRPATPATGAVRYNTSLTSLEIWNGSAWRQLAAQGTVTLVVDDLGTAGGTGYTMSQAAPGDLEENVIVFVGNIHQNPFSAYTVTGTTLTMSTSVTPGDRVVVYHGMNSTVVV
jgi:hypothetical protein